MRQANASAQHPQQREDATPAQPQADRRDSGEHQLDDDRTDRVARQRRRVVGEHRARLVAQQRELDGVAGVRSVRLERGHDERHHEQSPLR